MKTRYISTRIEQCIILSQQSSCPRRQIGAIIVDPESNSVLSDGYNGPPRGGDTLCGGNHCERDTLSILSGVQLERGCHHAEMNAILNAARMGTRTLGAVMIITAEPCLMCAKAIHHAGLKSIYIVEDGYSGASYIGIPYLKENNVNVHAIRREGPQQS